MHPSSIYFRRRVHFNVGEDSPETGVVHAVIVVHGISAKHPQHILFYHGPPNQRDMGKGGEAVAANLVKPRSFSAAFVDFMCLMVIAERGVDIEGVADEKGGYKWLKFH